MANINDLYFKLQSMMINELESDEFYTHYMNLLIDGKHDVSLFQKAVRRNIDMQWVEAIEDAIIPLDTIIRNPNRFIRNDEEIVPIEMSRNVTIESIKHLAQHTNMIAEVKGDTVTPNKILNVRKEESFETYENRFIYTLVKKIQYFLDKRLQALLTDYKQDDIANLKFAGEFEKDGEKLEYDINLNYVTKNSLQKSSDELITMDTSKMTDMQRIERVRLIIFDFTRSQLFKDLAGCALVKPPLNMTNVLKRNPNFRKAVDLWRFVETYEGLGYNLEYIDRQVEPNEQYLSELYALTVLEIAGLKAYTGSGVKEIKKEEKQKKVITNYIEHQITEVMTKFDLSIDDVKRVYIEKIETESKIKDNEFKKAKEILKRALSVEADKEKTEIALEKEAIRKQKLKEQKKEEERQAKLLQKQKEKEEALRKKALQKEKERLKKERLKELEKLKKESQKEREKAKKALALERKKEKERLKKAKLKEQEQNKKKNIKK